MWSSHPLSAVHGTSLALHSGKLKLLEITWDCAVVHAVLLTRHEMVSIIVHDEQHVQWEGSAHVWIGGGVFKE